MYKKIIYLIVILAIGCVIITGCKKKDDVTADGPKTPEQYKAEAEKEITEENLSSELEKLDKEIAEDEMAERREGL